MIPALELLASPMQGRFHISPCPADGNGWPGVLTMGKQGFAEAKVSFGDDPSAPKPKLGDPDIITGVLSDSTKVTMLRNACILRSTGRSPLGYEAESTYSSPLLLQGNCHCAGPDVKFDEVTIRAHHLNLWVERELLAWSGGDPAGAKIDIRYGGEQSLFASDLPKQGRFEITSGFLGGRGTHCTSDVQEGTLKASNFMKRKFPAAWGIDDVLLDIQAVVNFLGLGLGYTTYCLHIGVSNSEMRKQRKFLELWVRGMLSETWGADRVNPLFSFSDIFPQLSDAFARWMEFYRTAASQPLNYYFDAEGVKDRYIDTHFLALARAIETLHGGIFGGRQNDECEEIKREVIASCAGKHRKWLSGKLQRACALSFRDRVCDFISNFTEMTGKPLPYEDKVVRQIVRIRNRATHHGILEKPEDDAVMSVLGGFLSLLVQHALLRKIGVNKSLRENYRSNEIVGNIRLLGEMRKL